MSFSLGRHSDFKFLHVCGCFCRFESLNVWFPKGKEGNQRERWEQVLALPIPPRLLQRAVAAIMVACLGVCTSVNRISDQQSERRHPILGGRGPYAYSGSCRVGTRCSRNRHTWLPATGLGLPPWEELKLGIKPDLLSKHFPASCQPLERLQSSETVTSGSAGQLLKMGSWWFPPAIFPGVTALLLLCFMDFILLYIYIHYKWMFLHSGELF